MSEIYAPEEDSYLLSEVLKKYIIKNKPKKVIEIGSGSGIQIQTLIDNGLNENKITAVDINPKAISHLKHKFPKAKIIKSNFFQNVKNKYDLIIFNPPYLPKDKFDKQRDTSGGKLGSEVINKFLKQAHKCLKNNGKILLLTSSLTNGIKFLDYNKKLIKKKKLFFEELYVYELWKK